MTVKKMKDVNHAKQARAVIQSVEFHPTASVVLTAGYHKTLDLFQVRQAHILLLSSLFCVLRLTNCLPIPALI